jgi:diguanylate cyclase (GGDEF)-like protein
MDPISIPIAPDSESAASLLARAAAVRRREPEAAVALAERALAAARDADAERPATALLGACLASIPAELPRAREVLADALARCEADGDHALRCEVLAELAAVHSAVTEFDAALWRAREAVALAQRLGRRDAESRALLQVGAALTGTGDFAEALRTLLEAMDAHEAAAPPGEPDDARRWERGELVGRIAIVYSNLEQGERALAHYAVALEAFGDRYPQSAARTLYRMGIAAGEGVGDWTRAEEYYRASLRLYEALGNRPGMGLANIGLASVLVATGAHEAADEAARHARAALADDPVHASYYADALWVQSDVHVQRGRYAEALACLEEALPLYRQTRRPPPHVSGLHDRFSTVLEKLGRYEDALRHHRRFHQLLVEHLQSAADAKMAAMMVRFDTEQALKDREIQRLRTIELEREVAERKEAEAALARARAELEERNRELHALTIRDPLTGAFNRRYLDQRLAEALPLAVRRIQPLSVMICDIDDFKRINDTFTHAVGDEVLRAVAGILRAHVRQSDVVARFGGEEFVVLFPAATLEQAVAASEKVCALVREWDWRAVDPELTVTISAGVAVADAQPTHEKLLADADRKLYEAKRLGKDRVVG